LQVRSTAWSSTSPPTAHRGTEHLLENIAESSAHIPAATEQILKVNPHSSAAESTGARTSSHS
jgi:hypothetical protein